MSNTLFESAQYEDLLCGRSLEGFSAVTVYATCRVQSVSRTMESRYAGACEQENESELKAAYDYGVDVTRIEVTDPANVSRMTIRPTATELKKCR